MKWLRVLAGILWSLVLAGLHAQAGEKQAERPVVPVSKPIQRQVIDFMDYMGRIHARETVTIVPRTTGYLLRALVKEGSIVKKDDLLFEIDARPYQALYDSAKARVIMDEAALKTAKVTNERFRAIWNANKSAVSRQKIDQYQSLEEQASAKAMLARVQLESAKLHLDWTKVASPINGHIGRYSLTPGNLVHKDVTQLTTVVSMDPMHVYFDMDERTLLRMKRIANEGKVAAAKQEDVPVMMGLMDEEGYPHKGNVTFADNHVNPSTGSIAMRAVFANPKSANGTYLLAPGMAVHVRLPIGQPYAALLVIDRAMITDQGAKFVYVVDAENKVRPRQVTVGGLELDGLRVIHTGLKLDDRVLVSGFHQVRPNLQVQPDLILMPSLVPL